MFITSDEVNVSVQKTYMENFAEHPIHIAHLGAIICISHSTFVACISPSLEGGAIFTNSSEFSMECCCFKSCSSMQRGSCCYICSVSIKSSFLSSSQSYTDFIGSFYLCYGKVSADNINESYSSAVEASGAYSYHIEMQSKIKYIGVHKVQSRCCIGFSDYAYNCNYSKYVVTDCLECTYVFRLVYADAELDDVYLWKVPKDLRYNLHTYKNIVVRNLYTNTVFEVTSNGVSIINQHNLNVIPNIETKSCFSTQSNYQKLSLVKAILINSLNLVILINFFY